MALRTFRSNPTLGGFGSGQNIASEHGDAFCQIVKELVDNAVDACCCETSSHPHSSSSSSSSSNNNNNSGGGGGGDSKRSTGETYKSKHNKVQPANHGVTPSCKRRVRVVIEPYRHIASNSDANTDETNQLDDVNPNKPNLSSSPSSPSPSSNMELLRVTVTDTGVGMKDIQFCVDPFSTSKQGAQSGTTPTPTPTSSPTTSTPSNINHTEHQQQQASYTAGRYGIGLTLCLLHTQRLVPDSAAIIRSATANQPSWMQATCVVDQDRVRCIQAMQLPKSYHDECGTSISVLVPGGTTAISVWPRLAEYFARFKLSRTLSCTLEILAPTLSTVPILVRPLLWVEEKEENEESKNNSQHNNYNKPAKKKHRTNQTDLEQQGREHIRRAVQRYLEQPVELRNVSHALVPIHINDQSVIDHPSRNNMSFLLDRPRLEVNVVIVHTDSNNDDEGDDLCGDSNEFRSKATNHEEERVNSNCWKSDDDDEDDDCGKMTLIRMVNRIPLLDTSEAIACGLVQGIANLKKLWASFGLSIVPYSVTKSHGENNSVNSNNLRSIMKLQTYSIRDSDQVAPFFQSRTHELFRRNETKTNTTTAVDESDADDAFEGATMRSPFYYLSDDHPRVSEPLKQPEKLKRVDKKKMTVSRQADRVVILPAKIRLAHCICILQIHAKPSALPLPTLSKGRLPLDNAAMDEALEVGLQSCLRQLQTSNPNLLLSPSQLRAMERDYRYIPAVASAYARMIHNCSNKDIQQHLLSTIASWDKDKQHLNTSSGSDFINLAHEDTDSRSTNNRSNRPPVLSAPDLGLEQVQALIEARFSLVVSEDGAKKIKKPTKISSKCAKGGKNKRSRPNKAVNAQVTGKRNDARKENENSAWYDPFMDADEEAIDVPHLATTNTNSRSAVVDDDDYNDWL